MSLNEKIRHLQKISFFTKETLKNMSVLEPGGVAQWTLHPPQKRMIRVQIPPGLFT
jgi:hypothetical protein